MEPVKRYRYRLCDVFFHQKQKSNSQKNQIAFIFIVLHEIFCLSPFSVCVALSLSVALLVSCNFGALIGKCLSVSAHFCRRINWEQYRRKKKIKVNLIKMENNIEQAKKMLANKHRNSNVESLNAYFLVLVVLIDARRRIEKTTFKLFEHFHIPLSSLLLIVIALGFALSFSFTIAILPLPPHSFLS